MLGVGEGMEEEAEHRGVSGNFLTMDAYHHASVQTHQMRTLRGNPNADYGLRGRLMG